LGGGLFCLRRRESHFVAQAGFELPHSSNSPISPSQVLGLQVCAITPRSVLFIFDLKIFFEVGSHYMVQAGLQLLNLWFCCLSLSKSTYWLNTKRTTMKEKKF
jgi:hypothetical protein